MQGGMHHHIVEGDTAGQCVLQHLALLPGVAAKVVKGQRPRAGVDLGDDLVNLIKRQNHHCRAEDFFMQNQAALGRVDHQLQRSAAVLLISRLRVG
ncbi:hypothetical protein D3C81_1459210 [compost metagenome]